MVRVGGMSYALSPLAGSGNRISDMRLGDKPVDAGKTYKVAGWAPVAEGVQGDPVWDVVAGWLRDRKTVPLKQPDQPRLIGLSDNLGLSSS